LPGSQTAPTLFGLIVFKPFVRVQLFSGACGPLLWLNAGHGTTSAGGKTCQMWFCFSDLGVRQYTS
jgi:hypothetical protein